MNCHSLVVAVAAAVVVDDGAVVVVHVEHNLMVEGKIFEWGFFFKHVVSRFSYTRYIIAKIYTKYICEKNTPHLHPSFRNYFQSANLM